MDKVQNYFEVKYYAACFEPLDDDFNGTCPVCGQKTTALNINKRLKLDEAVNEKYRNAPKKAAVIFGAAGIIQLVYSIIIILMITGVMNSPTTQTETAPVESAYSDTENDGAYYINKAMKFNKYADFIEDCKPLAYDEDFYKWIWKASIDIRINCDNRHEMPQDPLPITETKPQDGGVTPSDIGGGLGIGVLSITVLASLIVIWCCIRALLDKDDSLNGLYKWCEVFGQSSMLTLNFIGLGLCFFGLWYLNKVNISFDGEKMRVLRRQKIHKAKNPLGNTDEWCCKYCGYINNKRDLECKSCGKYR